MKRTFLLLTLVMIALYGKLGYELFLEDSHLKSSLSGSLSDIAETVTAIPLQSTGEEPINHIKCFRQEGDNLFLVSNNILYRFRKSGEFICRITNPEAIQVAGYVIDPLVKQLIVLGNEDDIHYYSFTGELLDKKKVVADNPFRQIRSITMHDNHIWTSEENVRLDPATEQLCIEKLVVKYDTSFRKIETHRLSSANLINKPFCSSFSQLELAIAEDTGSVYAYSPALEPDYLLQDTLLLRRRQLTPGHSLYAGNIAVYPLRFGRRYWLSSYDNPADPSQNYTFCFDQDSSKSWQVKGGFKDNFYHTGSIRKLQALDAYSNSYYYCKSGNEVKQAFPNRSETDSPVVFIVSLKG